VSKGAGVGKATSTKAKTAAVKTKAPATETKAVKIDATKINATRTKTITIEAVETEADKIKTTKAKPEVMSAAKKPVAEIKKPEAKTGKRNDNVREKGEDAAGFRINEPVLDPIGDVISGEARTYLGEPENLGKVEMDAYREETEVSAVDGTLEDGPGMAAASGADAAAGAEEDEDEDGAEKDAAAARRPPAKLERLQKILSQAGVASRRTAEEMIVAGQVMVNGQVVTQLGSKADAGRDHIRVNGKLLKGAERRRYFMLNKPKGYVTTVSDPEKRPTVMDFFAKTSERLYPVGRLDYQSEGLLLMTNDGELANLLTKAGSGVEKVYLVKVAGQPSEEELERLRGGVTIEKGEVGSARVRTAPARIRLVRVGENPWYEVVLTEGRNRELRKMFAAIGHFAEKIRRVEYGPLVLDMEPGKMRELTEAEVNALRLTAEGKLKPRRTKLDISLPKEAGRKKLGPREQGNKGPREREDRGPGDRKFEKPRGGGFAGKPRVFGERPRFDKRASGPPRAGSGFGARPTRPFGAKPGFGAKPSFSGGREGGAPRSGDRKEWKPRGPEFGGKPGERLAGRFDGAARKPFRPQGERSFSKPDEGPAKRFDSGRDPGRRVGSKARWVARPDRARNEEGRGPARGRERPGAGFGEKRWEGKGAATGTERGKPGYGARPDAGRPRPAFGARPTGDARPDGFKRPDRPGGFAKPGGFSKPGGFAKLGGFSRPGGFSKQRGFSKPGGSSKAGKPGGGESRGGSRFGGKRPGGR
jgi:23S rRNA pseudouridine2605 synthase